MEEYLRPGGEYRVQHRKKRIRNCSLIVRDECPMAHKLTIEGRVPMHACGGCECAASRVRGYARMHSQGGRELTFSLQGNLLLLAQLLSLGV